MIITLVGSRYFGASLFDALAKDGVDIARVVAPDPDDRLAVAAKAAGVPVTSSRIRGSSPARQSRIRPA